MPEAPPLLKTCKKCERLLPQTEFYKNRGMRDGLLNDCKDCVLAYQASLWANQETRSKIQRRQKRFYADNQSEILAKEAARRATWTDEQREYLQERRHGLPRGTYRRMLGEQCGGCKVCGNPPGVRRLAFDHDHACCPGPYSCGQCVRALLCSRCNVLLGQSEEDPALLRQLADYLESARQPA